MRLADRFEHATAVDPSLNYCLWDYRPAAPAEDKWRSVNLLYQSFDLAGLGDRAFQLVDALRESIGAFRTVFGIKLVGDRLAWEFYFYDYDRQQRSVSASRVLAALQPWLGCKLQVDEQLPYFMFSLDFDADIAAGNRALDVAHLYIGNPGSAVSSGIAYGLRRGGCTLENFYFFFDAVRERDQIIDKLNCSAHGIAGQVPIEQVLVPELADCTTVCVANKSGHDCIYFSGVDVGQLAYFLARLDYPAPVRQFVAEHRDRLDHLRFDVGFDYRAEGGRLQILKSGYYGVF